MTILLVLFDRNLKLGLWKHIKVCDTACNLRTLVIDLKSNFSEICHSAELKIDMNIESFSLDNPVIFRTFVGGNLLELRKI